MKNQLAIMSRKAARELTDKINSSAEDLAGMLKRAHDGNAWSALGYATWNDFVKAEIKLCKSRVFQLLDFETIRSGLVESTTVDLIPQSERQARPLTKLPVEQQPAAWARAVESAGGSQPTAAQVAAVVDEILTDDEDGPVPTLTPEQRKENLTESEQHALEMLKRSYSKAVKRWLGTLPVRLRREFFAWVAAQAPK